MSEKVITAIIAAFSAIIGSIIPQVFSHLKRREEFKRVLFDKKFTFYSRLVGISSKISGSLIADCKNKAGSEHIPDPVFNSEVRSFMDLVIENRLLLSREVGSLAMDFIEKCSAKLDIGSKITETGLVTQALDKQCRKELGIKKLERELYKLN